MSRRPQKRWMLEYLGVRFGEPIAEVKAATLASARKAALAGCALVIADSARIYECTREGLILRDLVALPRDDAHGARLHLHLDALLEIVRQVLREDLQAR